MLLSCWVFWSHWGVVACKPGKAAVCHCVVGGGKGLGCVTHDALSMLKYIPTTSDLASLAG